MLAELKFVENPKTNIGGYIGGAIAGHFAKEKVNICSPR
jgi:hypothetical protein